jgi:hypothetical protein
MQGQPWGSLETERARSQEAARAGLKHLALLHLVRCRLLAGKIDGDQPPASRPLVLVPRLHAADAVAFLGCFSAPDRDYVLPLKTGVNRVGRSPIFGDHQENPARPPVLEPRQWLIICRQPGGMLVADDHSSNGSLVLPRDSAAIRQTSDPSSLEAVFLRAPAQSKLDWHGNVVHELHEGDVLVTAYAAFVVGCIPPQPR